MDKSNNALGKYKSRTLIKEQKERRVAIKAVRYRVCLFSISTTFCVKVGNYFLHINGTRICA